MTIDDDRQISRFVPDRLPEFVRVDHPTLVSFLEAYYEWLGLRRDAGIILSPMEMHNIPDVDSSLEQFIENFKSQYLFNFPESLAISRETGNPVDARRLVKNIKQFYQAKGTEKSYEFLFRILYDTNVEFYYPKTDILRLSSGRWTQNNYLRVSNALGDQIFNAAGNLIVQRNAAGQITATAKVISVNVYQIDNFDVAELLITGRNGTFQTGDAGIEFESEGKTYREVRVFSVVSTIDITNGGADYQLGERVNFVAAQGDSGQRGRGTVVEVDAVGGIRKINIDDFGINYGIAPSISIETSRGTGFSGTATIGSLCQSFGYYTNNDGRLSTNKVIQDNHYYQNWSYVLKSEVVIDTYREMIRRLVHPVGTAMFGSVLVKRCSKADIHNATALMSFHIPHIGNYAAYTVNTFDDLSLWFQESVTGGMTAAGYAPDTHDSLIAQEGDGLASLGNPISNNVQFVGATAGILTTAGFPDADPFWIVYPHANKQVDRGYHYARIWRNQARQMITWSEWYYNKEKDYSESRYQWMREADSSLDQTDSLTQFKRYVTMPAGAGGGEGGIAGGNPPHAFICCIPGGSVDEPGCNQNCGTPATSPCLPFCQCQGGEWNNGICTCPNGLIAVWDDIENRYVCPSGGDGDVDPPSADLCPWCLCGCDNYPTCNECEPCADPCQDPRCSNYDCCACEGLGSDCCTKPTPCWIDPFGQGQDPCDCEELWRFNPGYVIGECCTRGRCTNACATLCQLYPFLDICRRTDGTTGELCDICPCHPSCPDRFCLPQCPTYDPCRIACDNFDYCSTGCSGYGPCHPSCPSFDICTSTGCSSYAPCDQICSPDPCATGTVCYNACVCGDPCNQSCTGFDWCYCDLGGATCCAENPCIPECNPDPCDPQSPCYDQCDPSCTGFDACLTACPGYGPCHPDCPEPPVGQYTRNRKPCNPLCPGFDRCNNNCPNYDSDFCCQGCNCGGGGGIGDPISRGSLPGNSIRQFENDNPIPRADDNNPCNNDTAPCIVGPYNYDLNAYSGTLLKYDENSEFGKITLRAFFNMPSGEAFDCREEKISGVAVPQFVISNPLSGQTVSSTSEDRPLTIAYTITNSENIGYYKIVQTNVYIDNRLVSTISINMTEFTVMGIADGRRTLKLEMIDADGNLVAGTQKIVIFGYQYIEPERSDDYTRLWIIGGDSQSPGLLVPDDGVPIGSQGIRPNVDDGQQRRQTWEFISCLNMRLERATQIALFIRQVYSCLHRLCDYPDPCDETDPQILAGFCHQDVCNSLSDVYRCMGIEWPFTCGQDDVDEHLGGLGGVLGRLLGTSGGPTSTPYGSTDAGGIIGGTLEGVLEALNEYDACKIWSCMTTISYRFGPQKTCVDPTPFTCPDGSTKLSCLQQLNAEGKNPFCFDPNEDEEFNRNMFRARFECPGWRYEYPGYYYERYWVEDGGYWYYTGRGWYGTEQEGMPEDDSEGRDLSLDRGDRFNDSRRRPRTNDEWRQIFQSVPCGRCATDNFGNDCNQYMTPTARRLDQYLQCATRALPRGGRYLDERQRDEVISRMRNCCERFIRQDDFPNATGPVCEIMEKCARNFKSGSDGKFRLGISTCFLILYFWERRLGSEGLFGTRQ